MMLVIEHVHQICIEWMDILGEKFPKKINHRKKGISKNICYCCFSCLLEYNPFQSSPILLLRAFPFGILCLFWVFYSFMPIMWYFQFVLHPVHQLLFCLKLAWPRALFSKTLNLFGLQVNLCLNSETYTPETLWWKEPLFILRICQ